MSSAVIIILGLVITMIVILFCVVIASSGIVLLNHNLGAWAEYFILAYTEMGLVVVFPLFLLSDQEKLLKEKDVPAIT